VKGTGAIQGSTPCGCFEVLTMPQINVRLDNDVVQIHVHESAIECVDGNVKLEDGDRLEAEYMDYHADR